MTNLVRFSNLNAKSLHDLVIRAGVWTLSGFIVSQLIRLGGNLILTRLLVPEMFGVMSIVAGIMAGLALLSDVGLNQNIVQSKHGEDPEFLNTAWVVQIFRGGLIFVIALLLSWLLSISIAHGWMPENTVYADPALPVIIAVMSITAFIAGFNSTNLAVSNRKLILARLTILELISQLFGLSIMIIWAYFDRTIWALVIGAIVASSSKMLLSHSVIPGHKNRFEWDPDAFHEILNFGKWIVLSSGLLFALSWGDRMILGGMIPAKVLGIYSIAYFLANAVKHAFKQLFGMVFYPALSKVARDQPNRLSVIYYRIRKKVDLVTMLVAGFLMATGEIIVSLLYDNRYADAGWMLRILAVTLIFVGPVLAGSCFMAMGKTKYVSFLIAIELLALYITLPISFMIWGLLGGIWAIALVPMWMLPANYWLARKSDFLNIMQEFSLLPLVPIGYLLGLFFLSLYNNA